MIIAVTYENGEIFGHFGRTAQFKLYEVEEKGSFPQAAPGTERLRGSSRRTESTPLSAAASAWALRRRSPGRA